MREHQLAGPDGLVGDTTEARRPVPAAATLKEIPYDHVVTFRLTGIPGTRLPGVINVSVDGAFVAVAIGYSFIPAPFMVALNDSGDLTRPVNTDIDTWSKFLEPAVGNDPRGLVQQLLSCLMVRLCGIDFKYSIIDSGAGRELQNLAIHNIAGLGKADGDRPFRPMAKPMLFMPRSTIRIEVQELSSLPIHRGAELFIVLHGYKILGYGTTPP
jgi:hypothetical protein